MAHLNCTVNVLDALLYCSRPSHEAVYQLLLDWAPWKEFFTAADGRIRNFEFNELYLFTTQCWVFLQDHSSRYDRTLDGNYFISKGQVHSGHWLERVHARCQNVAPRVPAQH